MAMGTFDVRLIFTKQRTDFMLKRKPVDCNENPKIFFQSMILKMKPMTVELF